MTSSKFALPNGSRLCKWHFFPLALLFCVLSCNEKETKTSAVKGDSLRFVFVTTCVNEDFFKPVQRGMQDAADLLGVECSFIGTPGVDVEGQVEMMRKAVSEGADGIALNIIDSVGFDAIVRETLANGIPVVGFNGDDNHTENMRLSSVCQNLYRAGTELGKKMAGKIAAGSEVILTVHSSGISSLEERVRGIKDALQSHNLRYIEVVTTNSVDTATQRITTSLQQNPSVKYILCTGLADTEGAGNAIQREFGKQGVAAAGFDLSAGIISHVKTGNLLFTIDQQPYMQGFLPVLQLTHYKRYGIIPSDNEIGAAFVTPENADEVEQLTAQGYR